MRGSRAPWPDPPTHPADFGKAPAEPWLYLSATWRPRPADQLEQETLGSLEGPPQDGTEDTGKPRLLATTAGAQSTETEGLEGFPEVTREKVCLRRRQEEDSLGSSPPFHQLPCPRSFCGCPAPPLLAAPSLPCSLRRTQDTEDHLLPASPHGQPQGKSPAPYRQEGMAETLDGKEATEPLSVPRSSSGVPGASG